MNQRPSSPAVLRVASWLMVSALMACGPGGADGSSADATGTSATELNSAVYTRARAYASANPTRDGGTWDQWCASLVWRFGRMPDSSARPSAIAAYHDSHIVSTDPSKALVGAIHWWDIGSFGHVGVDLNGGGSTVFMATRHLAHTWGDAIGVNSVHAYSNTTGARYLGWSMDYAGSKIPGGGAAPGGGGLPKTRTEQTGVPDSDYYKRIQTLGRRDFGFKGPLDGTNDAETNKTRVRIIARELNRRGSPRTSAEDDGVPGPVYWLRVQTVGRDSFGYLGALDGIPGHLTNIAENMIGGYTVNRAL